MTCTTACRTPCRSSPPDGFVDEFVRILVGGYGDVCHGCHRQLRAYDHQWIRSIPGQGGHTRICDDCHDRGDQVLW